VKIQLQSLRVLNGGPLRDVCIHFNTDGDSPVTVLAGANGSGKTTALELIFGLAEMLLPRSGMPPVRPALLRAEYTEMKWLVDGNEFDLFYGRRPYDATSTKDYLGWFDIPGGRAEHVQGEIANTLRAGIRQQEEAVIDPFAAGVDESNLKVPSILFFPHMRFIPPVIGQQMYKEAIKCQWTYLYKNIELFEGSLDSYLVWLDYVEHDAYEKAIDFLNKLDIDGKTFSMSRRDFKVLVTTPNGGSHFLEGMSSGEQHLLIILMELRRRVLPHSIVLIDEIENSLHPAFQKKLAELLKRMQKLIPFQLIVTTHSLAIVESFGPTSTRILTEF